MVTLDGPLTVTEGWASAGAAIRTRAIRRRAGDSFLIRLAPFTMRGAERGPSWTVTIRPHGLAGEHSRPSSLTCASLSDFHYTDLPGRTLQGGQTAQKRLEIERFSL